MARLRVALVGAGRAGAVHAGNLADYAARAELAAVVDERREAAEVLAGRFGGRGASPTSSRRSEGSTRW